MNYYVQYLGNAMKNYLLLAIAATVLCSHDMYLKLDSYYIEPNSEARIMLYNGTFEQSENTIDRSRMIDVSLFGVGQRNGVDSTQWVEEGNATILEFKTGEPGTWVAGVSTRARNIEMDAPTFNEYLEHDGVLDMLQWRKENDALDKDAIEKYSKHVKTIFQVGDELSLDWQSSLGYPIEFIPLNNPYDLHPGHALELELLFEGAPLANQLVYAGSAHSDGSQHEEHSHDHQHGTEDPGGQDHHHDMQQLRTDANGRVSLNITHEGVWYVRTIHLVESEEEGLTHESNWATLTFEVGQGHSHQHTDGHDHSASDDQPGGFPNYVYWIGSLLLVLSLFLIFNRKGK